jgi:trk system potassium uptake protein TrkH
MGLFDAVTHTFGTMATGGFSTRNASVGHYRGAYPQIVITVFMMLAGANFTLYYRLLRGQLHSLWRDSELKAYLLIFAAGSLAIAVNLGGFLPASFGGRLRAGAFQVASILTTTGFATEDFGQWPNFSKTVLFVLMFLGGCAGSTGGGVKVVRYVTLFKQAATELRYQLNPRGIFFTYLCVLFASIVVVAGGGYDLLTSITASLATLGNIGPGLELIGPAANYSHFPAYIKWWLSFAMLTGRLELYTVLLPLTREFWRRWRACGGFSTRRAGRPAPGA